MKKENRHEIRSGSANMAPPPAGAEMNLKERENQFVKEMLIKQGLSEKTADYLVEIRNLPKEEKNQRISDLSFFDSKGGSKFMSKEMQDFLSSLPKEEKEIIKNKLIYILELLTY